MRVRFAAIYALLALTLAGAAVLGYTAWPAPAERTAPNPCWSTGSTLGVALHKAAECRFGTERVAQLGWMPYLGAQPGQSIAEVAVLDPLGKYTFWLASYGTSVEPTGVEVRHWTPCRADDEYC
jgi:hypothetical protein